jgi:hypothetical protein
LNPGQEEIEERRRQALEVGRELAENAEYPAARKTKLRSVQRIADREGRLEGARVVERRRRGGAVEVGARGCESAAEEYRRLRRARLSDAGARAARTPYEYPAHARCEAGHGFAMRLPDGRSSCVAAPDEQDSCGQAEKG